MSLEWARLRKTAVISTNRSELVSGNSNEALSCSWPMKYFGNGLNLIGDRPHCWSTRRSSNWNHGVGKAPGQLLFFDVKVEIKLFNYF